MGGDLTPEHSWKMVIRHYHSFRGQFGYSYPGIKAVIGYFVAAELHRRLFARTSHYTLIMSPKREYYVYSHTVRIEEADNLLTFFCFDSCSNQYVILGHTAPSDIVGMCEKCLARLLPSD